MNIKLISNSIKDVVEELLPWRKGKRSLIRSARHFSNISALELQSIFNEIKFDLVLDVGANSGQFYSYLRNVVGYQGRIHSFEPNPTVFMNLEELSRKDRAWQVFPFALGAADGVLPFNIYPDSKLSSFLTGDKTTSERFQDKFNAESSIDVQVKILDELIGASLGTMNISSIFLKLDTQGFDLEVLKGLRAYKQLVKFVQTELSVIPIYNKMPHYTESITFLEKLGYKIISLVPVTREKSKGYVIEFDALWGLQE